MPAFFQRGVFRIEGEFPEERDEVHLHRVLCLVRLHFEVERYSGGGEHGGEHPAGFALGGSFAETFRRDGGKDEFSGSVFTADRHSGGGRINLTRSVEDGQFEFVMPVHVVVVPSVPPEHIRGIGRGQCSADFLFLHIHCKRKPSGAPLFSRVNVEDASAVVDEVQQLETRPVEFRKIRIGDEERVNLRKGVGAEVIELPEAAVKPFQKTFSVFASPERRFAGEGRAGIEIADEIGQNPGRRGVFSDPFGNLQLRGDPASLASGVFQKRSLVEVESGDQERTEVSCRGTAEDVRCEHIAVSIVRPVQFIRCVFLIRGSDRTGSAPAVKVAVLQIVECGVSGGVDEGLTAADFDEFGRGALLLFQDQNVQPVCCKHIQIRQLTEFCKRAASDDEDSVFRGIVEVFQRLRFRAEFAECGKSIRVHAEHIKF